MKPSFTKKPKKRTRVSAADLEKIKNQESTMSSQLTRLNALLVGGASSPSKGSVRTQERSGYGTGDDAELLEYLDEAIAGLAEAEDNLEGAADVITGPGKGKMKKVLQTVRQARAVAEGVAKRAGLFD